MLGVGLIHHLSCRHGGTDEVAVAPLKADALRRGHGLPRVGMPHERIHELPYRPALVPRVACAHSDVGSAPVEVPCLGAAHVALEQFAEVFVPEHGYEGGASARIVLGEGRQ